MNRAELEAVVEACGVDLSADGHQSDLVRSMVDSIVDKPAAEALAILLRWEDHEWRQIGGKR